MPIFEAMSGDPQASRRRTRARRHFGNFAEERRTVELFGRPVAITKRVKDADGIELGVRFLYQPLDIALVVSTMIIPSVG